MLLIAKKRTLGCIMQFRVSEYLQNLKLKNGPPSTQRYQTLYELTLRVLHKIMSPDMFAVTCCRDFCVLKLKEKIIFALNDLQFLNS